MPKLSAIAQRLQPRLDDELYLIDQAGPTGYSVQLDQIRSWVSVKDYGAVGDGTTDDSVAIQAAYDALPTNGGMLIFPPAAYYVPTAIAGTKNNTVFLAIGTGMYLGTPSVNLITDSANYVLDLGSASVSNHGGPVIDGIGFTDSGGISPGAIRIRRMNHTRINNTSCRNFVTGACYEFDGTGDATILNMVTGTKNRNNKFGIKTVAHASVYSYGGFFVVPSASPITGSIALAVSTGGRIYGTAVDNYELAVHLLSEQGYVNARLESNDLGIRVDKDSGRNLITGTNFISNTANIVLEDPSLGSVSTRGLNTIMGNMYTPASNLLITDENTLATYSNSIIEPTYGVFDIDFAAFTKTFTGRIRNRRGAATSHTEWEVSANQGNSKIVIGMDFNGPGWIGTTTNHDFILRHNELDIALINADGLDLGLNSKSLKIEVVATGSLPAAGASEDGRILLEDNGAGDRNIVIYAGGQRFRLDGGASF